MEFAFEGQELPLETLRTYIRNEVASFDETPERSTTPLTKSGNKKGDYTPQDGFAISKCHFHVSNRYEPVGVLGEGTYGIVW